MERITVDLTEQDAQAWRQIRLDRNMSTDTGVAICLIKMYNQLRDETYTSLACSNCKKSIPPSAALCAACSSFPRSSFHADDNTSQHVSSDMDNNQKNEQATTSTDQQLGTCQHCQRQLPAADSSCANSSIVCKICSQAFSSFKASENAKDSHLSSSPAQVIAASDLKPEDDKTQRFVRRSQRSKTQTMGTNNSRKVVTNSGSDSSEEDKATLSASDPSCECENTDVTGQQCVVPFALQKSLDQHAAEVCARDICRPFQCQSCSLSYSTASHLKVHVRSHSAASPYQCEHCGLVCSQSDQLQLHVLSHAQHKPFTCSECSLTFTRASYLTVHVRNSHTGEKPYKCSQCGVAYADARNLKAHLRKHTGERPFLCHQCGKSFAERSTLARHRRQHSGVKPYSCKICGTKFTCSGSLKYHMRRHQGVKLYLCDECGTSFTSSSHLAQHRRTHLTLRPFACLECGATFKRAQALRTHSLNHAGQKVVRRLKQYVCEYCQAVYTNSTNFTHHVRVHTGEKPYACSGCDAAFAQNGDLKKHFRIHTGEKPFLCVHCCARFRHSSGLTVHLRIHSGEKPYKCEHCDSAFVSSSKLTSHVRSRHKSVSVDI